MKEPLHLLCPACRAVNRLPVDRLGAGPRCGRCRRPLFSGEPTAVGGEELQSHLASDGIPLLVDFWAPWCGPCRAMKPVFAAAAGQLEPGVRLLTLDTEAEGETAARFGIRSVPTLVLFKGGREAARTSGATDLGSLLGWVRSHLP